MNVFVVPKAEDEKSVLKTVRLKSSTLDKVKNLADKNNISVNRLINASIEFALDNISDKDLKNKN